MDEKLPGNVSLSEVVEENTLSESAYIPTTTEFPIQEPSIAAQPISGQQIEEVSELLSTEEAIEENQTNLEEEKQEETEEKTVELPIPVKEEVKEDENAEEVYAEITSYVDPSEYEAELPTPGEVNSESFMVPEYNPAMEAYAKKPKKERQKRKKYKKRSFFRRVREKITTYLRKLTLKDIRFMDDED